MSPINNIIGLTEQFKKIQQDDDPQKIRSSQQTQAGKIAYESTNNVKSTDRVDISPEGKLLLDRQAEVIKYAKELDSVETIDKKGLNEIKERVDSNYYSKLSINEKIADSLVPQKSQSQIPVNDLITEKNTVSLADDPGRSAVINSNIQNKTYDSDEVLDVVADQIIKSSTF